MVTPRGMLSGLAWFGSGRGWAMLGYLAGICGVALSSIGISLLGPNVRTSEMLYLVPVVFVATRWGIGPAVVASLAAFLTYHWLVARAGGISPPSRPEDWLSLLVLLFAASITGQLAVWARRESARAREAELLRSSDELKSALLHAVSHDLRTPLASIKASVTGLLHPDARLDEGDRRELLSAIDEETDRLTHLVTNLLDLSRLEAGSLRIEKDWHDLGEVIHSVVDPLQAQTGNQEVRIEVAADLPLVSLDYALVERILANLVENALRYGGTRGPVEVKARRDGSLVRVEVADRGPGVPLAERDRIFERFYQRERRSGGVGLGLAIARGMAEAHGGQLWVEARAGGGARFAFTLPLEVASDSPPDATVQLAGDPAAVSRESGEPRLETVR